MQKKKMSRKAVTAFRLIFFEFFKTKKSSSRKRDEDLPKKYGLT
jgi:hypothetical protein